MYTNGLLLNALGSVDVAFFLVCLGIVIAIVAVYFLIPVFNKSQYEERRNNLRKREAAFKKSSAGRPQDETAYVSDANGSEATLTVENSTTNEAAQYVPVSEVEKVTEE